MDPLLPRHTWREFLDIRFEHHITVQERTDDDGTHSYSAMNCPPAEEFIRQSDPDPTIVERILEGFLSFLEHKGCLDDLLPVDLDLALRRLQRRLPGLDLVDEPVVMLFHAQLQDIVDMAVVALTSTDDEPVDVLLVSPSRIFSQQGDSTWVTWNSRTHEHIKTTAIEGKRPRVLFHHAPDLQLENNYVPDVEQVGSKAMATRMWLHLASAKPESRFGHFFSGISAVFVEKVLLQACHNALLVSPHHHLFRDDNPPTSTEYPFVTDTQFCHRGIPLLAMLTFLHLPNESVRQGILPVVRNVISVQDQTGRKVVFNAGNSENEVSAETIRASTISLSMEYPGMNRLPRLLVPQTPHNAPSMDTSLLSSSSSSCSSEDHLPSCPPLLVDVEVSKLLSYGTTAQVWRGCLSSGQGIIPIIVKMFSKRNFDYMKKEMLAYQLISSRHLDDLAPLYYGVFTRPDRSWGAIVLSDAGEAFRGTWKEAGFSVQELQVVWKHLKTLHSLGLHHHDLAPRNVAKGRDGNLRLLDYERSSTDGRSCPCDELNTLERVFDSLADWRQ
ncbi:hypothetical protein IW261DRAFT_1145883 [Armillaria novae-zelandiae]|uniref:Protein kinase domain-containing protein n=1 Tax=Armillaria novae-zelandiae TaxID=153914 RepID=A0AA39PAX9_9AGAR|nr:hypothetical protein IW261DRAFT_1145883 [Armillaria novae-zelandiae]